MSSNRASALRDLKAARTSGKVSRLKSFKQDKDGSKVFDELDDRQYQAVVRKRLEDDFVVDDDGLGYVDYGEDNWDDEQDYSSDEDSEHYDKFKGKASSKVNGKKSQQQSINTLLQKQSMKVVGPKSKVGGDFSSAKCKNNDEADVDLLADMLGEVDEASKEIAAKRKKLDHPRQQSGYDRHAQQQHHSVNREAKRFKVDQDMVNSRQDYDDFNQSGYQDSMQQDVPESNKSANYPDQSQQDCMQTVEDQSNAADIQSPSLHSTVDKVDPEPVPLEDQIKVVDKVIKKDKSKILKAAFTGPTRNVNSLPSQDLNAQNVFSNYNSQQASGLMNIESSQASINKSVGGINNINTNALVPSNNQLGSDFEIRFLGGPNGDKLFMYWLDAYEGQSGVVYLFGKVYDSIQKQFISCCLTVNDIERSVYLLPRPFVVDKNGVQQDDEEVTLESLWQEVDGVMTRKKIGKWSMNTVSKKYAFEVPEIPAEGEWVEVSYGYNYPPLSREMSGKTFSHVFGGSTSALENLILRCKMMGPCWLEISNAQHSPLNISWCKVEAKTVLSSSSTDQNDAVYSIRPVQDSDLDKNLVPQYCKSSPPLTVLSMNVKTVHNYKKNQNEIVMVSLLSYDKIQVDGQTEEVDQQSFSVCTIVNELEGQGFPMHLQESIAQSKGNVKTVKGERILLNLLIAMLQKIDHDMYVGHNLSGFGLDVVVSALKRFNTTGWSKLGRLRRSNWPRLNSSQNDSSKNIKEVISGRLMCDTFWLGKSYIKSNSYSLGVLAKSVLGMERPELDVEQVPQFYNTAKDLLWLVKHNENDAFLAMQLVFRIMLIPLTKQLTNLAGNLWQKTLTTGRSDCNEYLLLHEFTNRGYIVPDKYWMEDAPKKNNGKVSQDGKKLNKMASVYDVDADQADQGDKKGRKKPQYLGGLVLEPKKGLYQNYVLLLDFNSLYPSIIQEFNICFTTVERSDQDVMGGGDENELPDLPDDSLEQGVLPALLSQLVGRRKQVKSLMKAADPNSSDYTQLNIRQQALKLTANSMYGCLGYVKSRFYAQALAKMITAKGREILQDTVNLAESLLNLDVIYGDTDSIMVNTKSDELSDVKKIGAKLKGEVNKKYKLLEIEMDGFFRRILILKKKKYAAITAVEQQGGSVKLDREVKGLDLVRRDWCDVSHDASDYVLNQILSEQDQDQVVLNIHQFIEQLGKDIREDKIPVEKFVINKALTKSPDAYGDAKSQPHVQVALKLKKKGIIMKAGETVPYVICKDEDMTKSFALRAYHPDDVIKSEGQLQIDHDYYLNVQVHPPIARLCQPIEGTSDSLLAQHLGLDASKFKSSNSAAQSSSSLSEDFGSSFTQNLDDIERFKNVKRLSLTCSLCKHVNTVDSMFNSDGTDGSVVLSSLHCQQCKQQMNIGMLCNQVLLQVRASIKLFGARSFTCDEVACGQKTRQLPADGKCPVKHCNGQLVMDINANTLYNQLYYWSSLFDCDRFMRKCKKSDLEKYQQVLLVNRPSMAKVHGVIKEYLDLNGRNVVNLSEVFNVRQCLRDLKLTGGIK
ncbi:hypothetical protein MP228_000770 [Amoeboaphelidium protococcarum]|nr:hypothetical protein MP228_000770 [Amoeboaphelidium protococcarum]